MLNCFSVVVVLFLGNFSVKVTGRACASSEAPELFWKQQESSQSVWSYENAAVTPGQNQILLGNSLQSI